MFLSLISPQTSTDSPDLDWLNTRSRNPNTPYKNRAGSGQEHMGTRMHILNPNIHSPKNSGTMPQSFRLETLN